MHSRRPSLSVLDRHTSDTNVEHGACLTNVDNKDAHRSTLPPQKSHTNLLYLCIPGAPKDTNELGPCIARWAAGYLQNLILSRGSWNTHFSQSWVRGLASRAMRASPVSVASLPAAALLGRGGSTAGRKVMTCRRSSRMRRAAAALECRWLVSLCLNSLCTVIRQSVSIYGTSSYTPPDDYTVAATFGAC